MSVDYCDLCDLPKSQCVHGMPAPAPAAKPAARKPSTAVRRSTKPAATSRASAPAAAAAPAKRVQRRWTPPDALGPHILAVLQDAGGELHQEDAFEALEARLADSLLAGDRETTPEGELRWQYAARRARHSLVAEGLMAKGQPGVWHLTAAGRRA